MKMKQITWILGILLGNFLLAFGVCAFVIPYDLILGGGTGLGLLFHQLFRVEVSTAVAILNAVMFAVGYGFLGKKFAFTTLLSSVIYPLYLNLLQSLPVLQNLTEDRMLATIFAGILMGAGVGLVMRMGASTGGMDIPPLVLNKKLGVPVSTGVYCCDTAVLLLQVPFSRTEAVLYGLVTVFLSSFVLNRVLMWGDDKVQAFIISDAYEEIGKQILYELNLGSSYILMESGLLGEQKKAVMTVLGKRRLKELQNTVLRIDPEAFVQIIDIATVQGRGFTLARRYQEASEADAALHRNR